MDHAAGTAALHHQGPSHVPQAPSVEDLKGRRQVASKWCGRSFSCDAAERWPRGNGQGHPGRAVRAEEHGPLVGRISLYPIGAEINPRRGLPVRPARTNMSRRGSSLDVLCERPVVSRSRIRSHWSSRSFNTYTILRHYIDVRNDFEIGSGQADTERV